MLIFVVHKKLNQNVNLLKKIKKKFIQTLCTCELEADNPGIVLSRSPRKNSFYLLKNYLMYLKYCNILGDGGACDALLH